MKRFSALFEPKPGTRILHPCPQMSSPIFVFNILPDDSEIIHRAGDLSWLKNPKKKPKGKTQRDRQTMQFYIDLVISFC
jgi:hypothetical protein